MHGSWGLWTALAALPVIIQPAVAVLPDIQLKDCEEGKRFDSIEDMGGLWGYSGAEQYAEAYIDANGDHSNWTQNLYMELFPDANHANSKYMRAMIIPESVSTAR
jgi:predicted oxidoreductase